MHTMTVVVLMTLWLLGGATMEAQNTHIERFSIAIPDSTIDDLRRRIRTARLPDMINDAQWDYGVNTDWLREMLGYWGGAFDWRAQERRLNAFDHFRTEIDGHRVHFVHQRSADPNATPLLLLHGWPSSFVQMLDIIPHLTTAVDGRAFHVVVASLPGFGFSDIPRQRGMSVYQMAPLMHRLMTDVLGYRRYGIRSSDLGAGIAASMALSFPDAIIGSHTGGTNPWIQEPLPGDLTPQEQEFVNKVRAWTQGEMAYAQMHATKPQTVAVGLNDSPAGLAAWILEKFHKWTDHDGRLENAISRDALLTNLTIYWITGTINSSMRLYYETVRGQGQWGTPKVPVGMLMPKKDMFPTPRSWVERQGPVSHWTETDRGGHFMEWEQPAVVARDLRVFFAKLQ